jgi:hypothetical protein
MKIIWIANNRRYLIGIGRNDVCPCGSHMKLKYCCLEKCRRPYLRGQVKKYPNLSERQLSRQTKRLARQRKFKRVARATKRYVAKMKRRNHNVQ